jgi:hypothetical protein
VLRNVTITVEEEILRWAKRKAADEDTSVSKLVARLLEREMKRPDIRTPEYMAAFERWKKLKPIPGVAADRLSREELHERRR